MSGFLGGFFDRLGDAADGITGKSDSNAFAQQLEQQRLLNEKIVELQRQEMLKKSSPEYAKQKQQKLYIASGIFAFCILIAAFIFVRK